jgi:hypothetical protein
MLHSCKDLVMQATGVPAAQETSMHMRAAAKQRAALAPDRRVLCSTGGIMTVSHVHAEAPFSVQKHIDTLM